MPPPDIYLSELTKPVRNKKTPDTVPDMELLPELCVRCVESGLQRDSPDLRLDVKDIGRADDDNNQGGDEPPDTHGQDIRNQFDDNDREKHRASLDQLQIVNIKAFDPAVEKLDEFHIIHLLYAE